MQPNQCLVPRPRPHVCLATANPGLNETDQSARVTAHVGVACNPTYIYAKPGPGGDGGLMIMANEVLRTLVLM